MNTVDKYSSFYRAHKEKLFGYLMRLTGDYQLSRDIMQESFTRYLENYGAVKQQPSLLYTIARNAFFDEARKDRRNKDRHPESEADTPDPEQQFLVREEYRKVVSAMQALEKNERDILSMVISTDMTYREIARVTRTSEANVKVKVHRARNKLRKTLSAGEQEK